MKSVMVAGPGLVEVVDRPVPMPGPDDVLVQVAACGICGTDLHIIDGEFPPARFPLNIGHEFGGTVAAVGANVLSVRVGNRVGIEPTLNCGACYFCQQGQGNLCENLGAVGVTHAHGGMSEYAVVPARSAYPLPDAMSMQAAALIEPVSCVVRGFHRLRPQVAESYLIYGAGPMGLLNAQVARYNGASLVAVIDINPDRLRRAQDDFGFSNVAQSFAELRGIAPRGFDNVIEATGVTKVAELALDAVKRQGSLLLFGVCPPGERAAFDPYRIFDEEITILGSRAVLNSFQPAIDLLAAGAIDVARMVSDSYPLEAFAEALARVRSGQGMKVQVGGVA